MTTETVTSTKELLTEFVRDMPDKITLAEAIEELQRRIAAELGFRLIDHRMELYAVPLDAPVHAAEEREAARAARTARAARREEH